MFWGLKRNYSNFFKNKEDVYLFIWKSSWPEPFAGQYAGFTLEVQKWSGHKIDKIKCYLESSKDSKSSQQTHKKDDW